MWNDSPRSLSRRGSLEDEPAKRQRLSDSDHDILKPVVSIKEESQREHRKKASVTGDVDGTSQEDSQMSHSGGGSDAEYDYGMEGPSGGSLPPSLMGTNIF